MVKLQVNGQTQSFDGDPSMPLLWYLRDELGLTGTKYGCGVALCGACTVHVDGEAARAGTSFAAITRLPVASTPFRKPRRLTFSITV